MTFNPQMFGFTPVASGRRGKPSINVDYDAYINITNQKCGDKRHDACRINIPNDICSQIVDSLGSTVGLAVNNDGCFVIYKGNNRKISKHDKQASSASISVDSMVDFFKKTLGGYGRYEYKMQNINNGQAYIFSLKDSDSAD